MLCQASIEFCFYVEILVKLIIYRLMNILCSRSFGNTTISGAYTKPNSILQQLLVECFIFHTNDKVEFQLTKKKISQNL